MRKAGKLTAQLVQELGNIAKPGISAIELDEYAATFAKKYNAICACYGYKKQGSAPFPGHICVSINHVICHGIPSHQIIKEGDIVSIDATLIVDGYHGDTCHTFAIGKITQEAQNLMEATKDALETGIAQAHANNHFGDIGNAIEELIAKKYKKKYSIVEDYCGHGIGTLFHQAPQVEHIKQKNKGQKIEPGMFFTIEPMINAGKKETRTLNDGWTVITKDYSLSAQFEHTLGVGENGVEIFTIC